MWCSYQRLQLNDCSVLWLCDSQFRFDSIWIVYMVIACLVIFPFFVGGRGITAHATKMCEGFSEVVWSFRVLFIILFRYIWTYERFWDIFDVIATKLPLTLYVRHTINIAHFHWINKEKKERKKKIERERVRECVFERIPVKKRRKLRKKSLFVFSLLSNKVLIGDRKKKTRNANEKNWKSFTFE